MYLKEIEVENFKSFKGEMTIPLDRGFTAITGPNGSGKSNCGDAIQFVLGPRSNKVLRAQNVKDLIFNGGKTHKPARSCSVTLIFANPVSNSGRRRLPIEKDEVRMSRQVRLTSSGNSVTSYLLNGESSTQRTFQRMLAQANARSDGYNIVLQGDVTSLSKMTANERRKVLDEVAGVTSYDDEIRKADRQRNQVEDYIERIGMLEEEQKARLKTLKKEREAAQKVKDLKDELDNSRTVHTQARHRSSKNEIKFNVEERTRYETEAEQMRQRISEGEKELQELDDKVGELERQLKDIMGGDGDELLENIRQLQLVVDRHSDRVSQVEERNKEDENEITILDSELKEAQTALEGHDTSLVAAKKSLDQAKEMFKEASKAEEEVRKSLSESGNANAQLTRNLSKAMEAVDAANAALVAAEVDLQGSIQHSEMLAEQLAQLQESAEEARLQVDELEIQGEEMGGLDTGKDRAELANELDRLQKQEVKLLSEYETIESKLIETTRRLANVRAEVEGRSGTSGMGGGAASVMAARDRGEVKGILGTIAELTAPKDSKHEQALSIAVGAGMTSIIVEDDQVASECIALLRQNKAGRATFLPLNRIQSTRPAGKAVMVSRKAGVLGFAHDLLEFDQRIESAVRYVLRNTLVVEDLATARRNMGGVRLVTLKGDVTEAGGAMVGGSIKRGMVGFSGRIQGSSEAEKLASEQERLQIMADTVSAALSESRRNQQAMRAKLTSLAEDEGSDKIAQWRAELKLAKSEHKRIHNEATVIEKRLEEADKAVNEARGSLESTRQSKDLAEQSRTDANEKLQAASPEHLREKLLEAQASRLEAEGMQTKASAILDAGNDTGDLLRNRCDEIQSRIASLTSSINTRNTQLESETSAVKQSEIDLQEAEQRRAQLLEEHQGLDQERMAFSEERAALRQNLTTIATEAQNRTRLAEELTRTLASKEESMVELCNEMALYGIKPAPEDQVLPSLGDAEKEVRKLERKLEGMGDVNMLAIEQYDAVELRLADMKDDFKTLQKRRKHLIDVTEQLESQRKTRLLATLESVNENFKVVYEKLSDGGRAELFLENPEQPFKGGLDMWAQPRGKSSKSRLQGLSGGEQSMASMALIFAIQDHDPSPFYYFDEVDQNLDAYNAERIAQMCRERSLNAQFIMVTLRKVSLRLADHHIGITHAGDGCSRRIADFDRERAIELGEKSLAEMKRQGKVEPVEEFEEEMPEVPEPLDSPSSLGGLTTFNELSQRADEMSDEINEHREQVSSQEEEEEPEIEEEQSLQ